MKLLLFVCISAFVITATLSIEPEVLKNLVKIVEACREANPVPDEEYKDIQKNIKVANSTNAKCLVRCIYNAAKFIENGKVRKEVAKQFSEMAFKEEPETQKKVNQIFERCISSVGEKVGEDECEFSYKLYNCELREAHENGVEFPDWV